MDMDRLDAPSATYGAGPTRSDAACEIPWLRDGYSAIALFVDPMLADRGAELCRLVNDLSAAHDDLDSLRDAVTRFAAGEGLSLTVYPDPQGELSAGVVAFAFTVG
ncbi:MAG TPA: hypothetical protein VF763_13585 [Candidatus Limnocylindrales bacterium]